MSSFWASKRVLVTGHTGFKGSWLNLLLNEFGAHVYGYALEPEPHAILFQQLKLHDQSGHFIGDILDQNLLMEKVSGIQPDIVFHLAAQPLVRRSYREPRDTWQTNVMGTINLLESVRRLSRKCSVIIVTTDKVYDNINANQAYSEVDRLGGHDPYSSSKAATELLVNSWRSSFFSTNSNIKLASVRAGNVIGGGDWSEDRIVPDLIRAVSANNELVVRNPASIRPWQHVLDPLFGYLVLAEKLYSSHNSELQGAFNFGPDGEGVRTVKELIEQAFLTWPGKLKNCESHDQLHEEKLLCLNINKAKEKLAWSPKWDFEQSVFETISWYKEVESGYSPIDVTLSQINKFASS